MWFCVLPSLSVDYVGENIHLLFKGFVAITSFEKSFSFGFDIRIEFWAQTFPPLFLDMRSIQMVFFPRRFLFTDTITDTITTDLWRSIMLNNISGRCIVYTNVACRYVINSQRTFETYTLMTLTLPRSKSELTGHVAASQTVMRRNDFNLSLHFITNTPWYLWILPNAMPHVSYKISEAMALINLNDDSIMSKKRSK